MSRVLTARTVATLKPGPTRQEIPDGGLPGLYFNIQPGGARSWAVRYRIGRRTRKFTIGSYPLHDLKRARQLGAQALQAVSEGKDPAADKVQSRTLQPDTVEAVVARFMKAHPLIRNIRESTRRLYQNKFNLHVLPYWGSRPIQSISKADVRERVGAVMVAGHPREANALLSTIKMLFLWAVAEDILPASPCVALKPPAILKPRERVLTDAELATIWRATDKINPEYAAAFRLLILTGQRFGEVAGMRWAEIDLDARLWRLPPERCKNNRAHEVPLSGPALAILTRLSRWSDFVLTFNGKKPMSTTWHVKDCVDALLPPDMTSWHIHDIRRSVITGLAKLGTPLPVVERIVNHVSGTFGGVQGVYQKFGFEDAKREALESWAAHVLKIADERPAVKRPRDTVRSLVLE